MSRPTSAAGFTLIEMIVVVFLLAIAMLGILAVFDASARINKSEADVADAQGAVRYGIYQMTRAIRMAGSGGLFITQAVLNARPNGIAGYSGIAVGGSFDNVPTNTQITSLNGNVDVRPGTDMIEVRGVINSPLIGFDLGSGCGGCTGSTSSLTVKSVTGDPITGQHVNDDAANRPQFGAVDAYTTGASAGSPMLVLVSSNDDIHTGCSQAFVAQHYPQPTYNVGVIKSPTNLGGGLTFGNVDFTDAVGTRINNESPAGPALAAQTLAALRYAGVLDDVIFFIDNSDPNHPSLAQGTRRGDAFDVVTLADDVEDMQIAYGVDTDNNNAINRRLGVAPISASDPDQNVSVTAGGDEWVPNVPGENTPFTFADFQSDAAAAAAGFPHPGSPPAAHCPRLHAVMITLVAKAKDPDPTYKSPTAFGFRAMNSPVTIAAPYPDTAQYPGLPGSPQFRRRVQTLKINLRNYAWEGA